MKIKVKVLLVEKIYYTIVLDRIENATTTTSNIVLHQKGRENFAHYYYLVGHRSFLIVGTWIAWTKVKSSAWTIAILSAATTL